MSEIKTFVALEVLDDEQKKEINDIVVKNGIGAEVALGLQASFEPLFREARRIMNESRAIVVTDAAQTVQIKMSREYRLLIRKTRIEGEKLHKSLKEDYLKKGRVVDAMKTLFVASLEGEEKRLDEQEKIVERAEAARKEALKTSREEALKPFGIDTSFLSLAEMPDATFAQLLENTRAGHEAKLARQRQAEADRISAENERIKEEARIREENARLKREADEREAAAKIDRDRVAKEKADADEALRVEREANAQKQRDADALAAKIKADADAALAKQKADADAEAARIKADADARAAKVKADADKAAKIAADKAKAEKDAADKIAADERAKREKLEADAKARADADRAAKAAEDTAARKAAAAPDRAKIEAFALAIRHIPVPALSSENAKLITLMHKQRKKLCDWIEAKAGTI